MSQLQEFIQNDKQNQLLKRDAESILKLFNINWKKIFQTTAKNLEQLENANKEQIVLINIQESVNIFLKKINYLKF